MMDRIDRNRYKTEANRWVRRGLEQISMTSHSHDRPYSWGLTIFRTVYTPESDESFPRAVENFFSLAKEFALGELSVQRARFESALDPSPNEALAKRFYCDIVEDAGSLDGAGPDQVGEQFDTWIEKHHHSKEWREFTTFGSTMGRFEFCIMLDQQGIDHLLQMMVDPAQQMLDPGDLYVKVVTAVKREDLDEDEQVDDHDTGRLWLRVGLSSNIMGLCIGLINVDMSLDEMAQSDAEDGILNYYGYVL